MLSSLVSTKLYIPPLRPDYVPRPRLVDALDQGYRAGRKLTLVCAPAGYGKTSLLSEWQVRLEERKTTLAWLALEESDNEPHRFMRYLIAAVRKVYPDLGQELVALFDLPQTPDPLEMAAAFVNEVAELDSTLVLALDDYHLIKNPAVHAIIAFLIDRAPANFHLVIASRYDPLLPLPRLRARGQMTEVRMRDLRFRREETGTFLRQAMHLNLPDTSLDALQERTEGWAAGLQLAAISLSDEERSSDQFIQSFAGDDRHILDYLFEEVLARQPADVQRFLLITCILEKFCAPLCDLLVKETEGDLILDGEEPASQLDARGALDYLDRANLFLIPLDNHREWYRYHHLFSEALRHHLHHQQPGLENRIHGGAARWFDQNNLPAPAFEHAIAAGDLDQAADIAERWLDAIIFDGQIDQARAWLQALPASLVGCRPELLFRKARMHGMSGEPEQSMQALDEMAACLEKMPDPLPRRPHLWTLNYVSRASRAEAQGELTLAQELLDRAMPWLPSDDLGLVALVSDCRGAILRSQGELKEAEKARMEMYRISLQYKSYLGVVSGISSTMRIVKDQGQPRRALQLANDFLAAYGEEVKDLPVLCLIYEGMAEMAYSLHRLEDAETWYLDTLERMKAGGIGDENGFVRVRLAQVKWALGKESQIETLLHEAEPWFRRGSHARHNLLSWATRVRIRLLQGQFSDAVQWATAYLPEIEKPYRKEFQDDTLALVWLAQSEALEALHFLENRQEFLERHEINFYLIENLAIQALALQRMGNQSEANEKLQRALRLAEPEGLSQTFLSLGFEMALLLSRLRGSLSPGDRLQTYLVQLLAEFPEKDRTNLPAAAQAETPYPAAATDDWFEALSEREVEVLRWMARGLSNVQIADQMVVAESTVKKHINHIFGKLGVENRTQALIKARERGLL